MSTMWAPVTTGRWDTWISRNNIPWSNPAFRVLSGPFSSACSFYLQTHQTTASRGSKLETYSMKVPISPWFICSFVRACFLPPHWTNWIFHLLGHTGHTTVFQARARSPDSQLWSRCIRRCSGSDLFQHLVQQISQWYSGLLSVAELGYPICQVIFAVHLAGSDSQARTFDGSAAGKCAQNGIHPRGLECLKTGYTGLP